MEKRSIAIAVFAIVVILMGSWIVFNENSKTDDVDYSDMDNWMFYPSEHTHDVDTLFFYPTVFCSDSDAKNSAIDDPGMRDLAQKAYIHQGSVFETAGDMFVPYYRQMTGQLLSKGDAAEISKATVSAYRDVAVALDYYFENNPDRPFILAGHSQGAVMVGLTLANYMKEHPEYLKNMVAAYCIGYPITQDYMDSNPHLKFAEKDDDTGVIVSWNTEIFGDPNDTGMFKIEGQLCINPLNWKTDGTYADIGMNHGSFLLLDDGTYGIAEGVVDAYIDEHGMVIVNADCDRTAAKTLSYEDVILIRIGVGPYCMHMDDYDFFYQNIRENAELRAETFLGENRADA